MWCKLLTSEVPSAINAATTKPAPALKSQALRVAPLNFLTPLMTVRCWRGGFNNDSGFNKWIYRISINTYG